MFRPWPPREGRKPHKTIQRIGSGRSRIVAALWAAVALLMLAVACAPAAAPAPTAAPKAAPAAQPTTAPAAPAAPAAPKADATPLKLGVVGPQSGGASAYGLALVAGLRMGFEEINAAGGIMGRKVELIAYDSQSTPTTAATLARKLISEDKVPILFGSASSLEALAMMEVTENAKLPLYVPSAASQKITSQGYQWVWRQSTIDTEFAKGLVQYAADTLKWKKVAALYENTDYGKPPMEVVVNEFKKRGVDMVMQEAFNVGDPDLSAQLLRLRDARADGYVFWGHYQEGALVVKQNVQLGLNLKIFGNSGPVYPAFLDLLDANAKKSSDFLASCQFVWTDDDPKQQAWVKKFKEKYGKDPDVTAMDSYDAAFIIKAVIEKAGGTDPAKVQATLREIKYDGVGGPISFDSTGQAKRTVVIVKLADGNFKVVDRVAIK